MNIQGTVRLSIIALATAAAGACGHGADVGSPADSSVARPSTATAAAASPTVRANSAAPAADSPQARAYASGARPEWTPDDIYYDLQQFDWYRRGEPLQANGEPYTLAGAPVRVADAAMDSAGDYQGVAYYRARAGTEGDVDAVYVPVFPHYWQTFVRRGGASVAASR